MAVIGGFYIYKNEDHRANYGGATYNGPQFPALTLTNSLTVSFWVYIEDEETNRIWEYSGAGVNAPYIAIGYDASDGFEWYFYHSPNRDTPPTQINIQDAGHQRWTHVTYVKQGTSHAVYLGGNDATPAVAYPLGTIPIQFPFGDFALKSPRGSGYCNLKVWDTALSAASIEGNRNTWFPFDANIPFWRCPLRRPGDIFNHAAVLPTDFWHETMEWTTFADIAQMAYMQDPVLLQKAPCQAILVPLIGVDPATPTVPKFQAIQGSTTRYALDSTYFILEDRATVPINYPTTPAPDLTIIDSVTYYGFPPNEGIKRQSIPAGSVRSEITYFAYVPETGSKAETLAPMTSAGFLVWDKTQVTPPYPIAMDTIYLWKWGAGFRWDNLTGAVAPALVGEFRQPVILVKYTGTWILEEVELSVLKISQLPIEILISPGGDEIINGNGPTTHVVTGIGGIYYVNPAKSQWHDTYYRNVAADPPNEKKIPDPTVKTALIGE